MRAFHALLFLMGCGLPVAGTGLDDAAADWIGRAVPESAQALLSEEDEPDPCRTDQPGRPRPARVQRDAPMKALFASQDAGAWRIDGRVRRDGSFFTTMADRNPAEPGSLFVQLHNEGGRATDLSLKAFGSELSYSEHFEGRDWDAATSVQRARQVREALTRYIALADGQCGARRASLAAEMASFEKAYRLFDRRER